MRTEYSTEELHSALSPHHSLLKKPPLPLLLDLLADEISCCLGY